LFGPKIKLDKELFERCKQYAAEKGYSSVDEFISHTLEKELKNKGTASEEDKEIAKKLKGLGYLE
jgi:metal-responsive CopG/Arc/MetJ family transcriptional regulator